MIYSLKRKISNLPFILFGNNKIMMIKFSITTLPIPWKAPFIGSKGCFSPRYREKKETQILIAAQYRGKLIKDPIRCDMIFYMPTPKKKKSGFCFSGGDLTNLRKFYEDCLQGIVIENDKQILTGNSSKKFCDTFHPLPKVSFCISSLLYSGA